LITDETASDPDEINSIARGMTSLVEIATNILPAPVRARAVTLADTILERTALEDPRIAPLFGNMTDEQAHVHFGEDDLLPARLHRTSVRLFHAWKVMKIRECLGDRLASARILDVGDSDGLLLRDLGKDSVGYNISETAIRNIRANGIEAILGDADSLPFADGSFDVVLCFETLEHIESQHAALLELARVCQPGGTCFVSIPWIPRTVLHPRDPRLARGQQHVFELSPADFASLATHTPFRLVSEDVCRLFASPRGPIEHLFLWCFRHQHLIGGTFRAFQFFELKRPDDR
jgi:SAM-dependent methyltransferase